MSIKKAINSFLQGIYVVFSTLIAIGAILLIIATITLIGANLDYDRSTLVFLVAVIFIIIFYLWRNRGRIFKAKNKNSSSYLLFEIMRLLVGSVFFFVFVINMGGKSMRNNKIDVQQTEEVILYTDSTDLGVNKYYLSQQTWKDFNRNKHSLPFKVDYENVLKSKKNRDNLKGYYRGDHIVFWNSFYKGLSDNDKPLIEGLAQTFFEYQKNMKMSRRDFAELMITAIQDIPYTLILNRNCLNSDIKPCVGNVRMGLFAPAEFISSLNGDCDTRTVLLYTLLSRFNYDVVILNSIEYEHSILGLQIPSSGKFKVHNRKKYYFVETTSRRNPIGFLHSQFSNIAYWDVVLATN